MQLVERVKMIASKQGFTLSQLEQHLGFGTRTIYKWDKSSPSIEKVLAVANFLNVPLSWLVTGKYETNVVSHSFLERYEMLSDTDKEKIDHFIEVSLSGRDFPDSKSLRRLPVLGYVSSQLPAEGVRFLGYTQTETDGDYALVMGDDSMKPLFYQGDYVFLKTTDSLAHGDIGVFLENHLLVCRQFLTGGTQVRLRPLDAGFPASDYSFATFSSVEVTGKVILSRRQADALSIFFEQKSNAFDFEVQKGGS